MAKATFVLPFVLTALAAFAVCSRADDDGDLEALLLKLEDKDTGNRRAALGGLAHLGPKAEKAVPKIVSMFNDDSVRDAAAAALEEIGPASLAPLCSISTAKRETRVRLIETVEGICTPRRQRLVDFQRNERYRKSLEERGIPADPKESDGVETAKSDLHTASSLATPTLCRLRKDADPIIRGLVARALGSMRFATAEGIKALLDLLSDKDASVRLRAANALAALEGLGKDAEKPLEARLTDPDPSVVSAVCGALGELGKDAATAIPAISQQLLRYNKPGDDTSKLDGLTLAIIPSAMAALIAIENGAMDPSATEKVVKVLIKRLAGTLDVHAEDYLQQVGARGLRFMTAAFVNKATDGRPALAKAIGVVLAPNHPVRADPSSEEGQRAMAALRDAAKEQDWKVREAATAALAIAEPK